MNNKEVDAQQHSSFREFHEAPFDKGYRTFLFFALLVVCAFIRLWNLSYKTMMHDELLFTNYTYNQLYLEFNYYYQPILHGPLMLHLQNFVFHIFGVSDYTVRLGVALLGIGGFFWIWKLRYWLQEAGTWYALAFYSISPGIVFFQRFFHQDALYLFCTLWIIASFLNWWRTGDGRWLASAILGVTALFTNKASAVFLYFTLITFLVFYIIHDLVSYIERGKAFEKKDKEYRLKSLPSPFVYAVGIVLVLVLITTQVFEGIRYERSVVQTLQHDWVLKDIRSLPLLLGWQGDMEQAHGSVGTAKFWLLFYGGAFFCVLFLGSFLNQCVKQQVGRIQLLNGLFGRIYTGRWYLFGALAASVVFYLAIYTTFFKHSIGFFQIYKNTWQYWGGQHEIGRIQGPFHQHLLNTIVYETASFFLILAFWLVSLFKGIRLFGLGGAFLLLAIPAALFHKLLFSGIEVIYPGSTNTSSVDIAWLKGLVAVYCFAGIALLTRPKWGKVLVPLTFLYTVMSGVLLFLSSKWQSIINLQVYKDGLPIRMVRDHVTMKEFMEIQYNFDGGWSLLIVITLVFFATIYTWALLSERKRFLAFSVWWFVTMLGSASYAREAVPQVGIHVMLASIILSAAIFQSLWVHSLSGSRPLKRIALVLLAIGLIWGFKSSVILNFRYPGDPRERMAYGPSSRDVKNHMEMIRDYAKIASLKMDESRNRPVFLDRYNERKEHKDVSIYLKTLDQVTWPAKWYLRDVAYEEGNNPQNAIDQGYDFVFASVEDAERLKSLDEYNVVRGRGTMFWTPDPIDTSRILDIWKAQIPGHYLDNTSDASAAYNAKQEWGLVRDYLIYRHAFDGTGRPVPALSSFDYIFCYRKDLY